MTASESPPTEPFVLSFDPESWGEAEKFVRFALWTHELNGAQAAALEGVVGHFKKAMTLRAVARGLQEGLRLDREEALERGFSGAARSEQFAAVVEEIFGELYACLDTTRQVLKAVYPKARGLKDKTSKLFADAAAGKLDTTIPEPVRFALAEAHDDWFWELRRVRTAVTHLSPGHCSLGEEGKVAYFNTALGTLSNSLEIADVWGEIGRYAAAVDGLLGEVFHELNTALKNKRVEKLCGVHAGHLYQRRVSPQEAVDFHSGVCISYEWFEEPDKPTCPMVGSCGAYERAKAKPGGAGA